jgi:putative tricarboxylic transport membrane protein
MSARQGTGQGLLLLQPACRCRRAGHVGRAAAYYQDLFKKIYDTEEWQGYLKSESLEALPKAPDEQRAYWKTQVENHTALLKALGE